jgi:SAM-dependent MidA family methyltransferase
MTAVTWRAAMTEALYGEGGFFVRGGRLEPPGGAGGHFRTSAHASALFATALLRLVVATDEALGRPARLDVVDIGAGGGHLLRRLSMLVPAFLRPRLHLAAVELAPRPDDLPDHIAWLTHAPPEGEVTGVLLATEWLDNIPLDVAEADAGGRLRYVLVDPLTGQESLGPTLSAADALWASKWWHPDGPGSRVEIGAPRDRAWSSAVSRLAAGLAVLVDYGHVWYSRPRLGTLAGYRDGRSTPAVPDGHHDITAHVAMDSVGVAGEAVAGALAVLTTQREALTALGLDGARPPLSLAAEDPAGYVQALSLASQAGELMDANGLGGHFWLLQPVNLGADALPPGLRPHR